MDSKAVSVRSARRTGTPRDPALVADLQLVRRCRDADPSALRQFHAQYGPEIRNVGARFVSGAELDDFVQRTLVHLLVGRDAAGPRIGGYLGNGTLRGFVRMTSSRLAIDDRRARARAQARTVDVVPGWLVEPTPRDSIEHAENRSRITRALTDALACLRTPERRAMRMRYVLGFSVRRTATALGVHETTVSRLVARARARLVAHLRTQLDDLADGSRALAALARGVDVSVSRHLVSNPETTVSRP